MKCGLHWSTKFVLACNQTKVGHNLTNSSGFHQLVCALFIIWEHVIHLFDLQYTKRKKETKGCHHVSSSTSNCSCVSCSDCSSSSKRAANLLFMWKTGCWASSYFLDSTGLRSLFSFLTPLPPPSGPFTLALSPLSVLSLRSPRSGRVPLPLPFGGPPPSLKSLRGPGGLLGKPFLSEDVGEVGDVTVMVLLSTLISTLCSPVGLFGSTVPVDAAFCCSIRCAHTFTAGGGASLGASFTAALTSFPPPCEFSREVGSASLLGVPSSLDLALSRRLRKSGLSRRSFPPLSPSLERLLSRRARPLEPRGHSSRSRRSLCLSFSCFNFASSSSFCRASFSSISRSLAAVSTGLAPPNTELSAAVSPLVSSTGLVRGWS